MIGGWELIVILLVVLVLFGGKKLPELARNLGKGIHEFKKAAQGMNDDISADAKKPFSEEPKQDKSSSSLIEKKENE